jgi:hypothetical protein
MRQRGWIAEKKERSQPEASDASNYQSAIVTEAVCIDSVLSLLPAQP